MAIGKFLAPLNGQMIKQQVEKPYVDDIFDPLFNAEVTNYYRNLYGTLGAIPAGYAAMLDNALTGRQGILGPGMGILSTFGRSMDKADDFILGGLTEGVNLVGRGLGGTNEAPQNPFKRIFVDDYDYQGTKLMAAAGNAMARLAGVNTPLDESDFQSLGDKIAGTTIDLATDPGIMGGQLARLNPNTPVGQVGQILSNYDDTVANVAGNMAFPGAKALIGKELTRIRDFLGANSSETPIDTTILGGKNTQYTPVVNPTTGEVLYSKLSPDTLNTLRDMASEYTMKEGLDPILNPEEFAIKEEIDNLTNTIVDEAGFQKQMADYTAQQAAKNKEFVDNLTALNTKAQKARDEVYSNVTEGINKHSADFQGRLTSEETLDSEFIKSLDFENQEDVDKLWDYIDDKFGTETTYSFGHKQEKGSMVEYLENLYEREGIEAVRDEVLHFSTKKSSFKSKYNFLPKEMGFHSRIAKEELKTISDYFEGYLAKHPEGFRTTALRDALGEDIYIPNDSLWSKLFKFSKGQLTTTTKFGTEQVQGRNLKDLINTLTDESKGLIPWAINNEAALKKTQLGTDLFNMLDNINENVIKKSSYETLIDGTNNINPSQLLNSVFSKIDNFTPEQIKAYAEDFKYFDIIDVDLQEKNIKKVNDYFAPLFNKYPATKEGYEMLSDVEKDELAKLRTLYREQLKKAKQDAIIVKGNDDYKYISENPINIVDKITKSLKKPKIEDFAVKSTLAEFNPEDFTKTVTNNFSYQDNIALQTYKDTFSEFTSSWSLPDDLPPETLEYYIKNFGTRREKTLFELWNSAVSSKIKNKLKMSSGALNVPIVKHSKELVDRIVKSKKYTPAQIAEYINRADLAEGVTLSGDNFLESLWASKGFKEIPLDRTVTKAQADVIAKNLKANVDLINKNGQIVKFVDVPAKAGQPRRLAIFFDFENINIKKDINKVYGLFGKKDLGLKDVTLRNKLETTTVFDTKDLDEAFKSIRDGTEYLATTLGYTKFSKNYISHAMEDSEEATKLFNGIYKDLGIDKDKLDKICQALQEQDIASGRLQFGAIPMERSHLGTFSQYAGGFSTDLSKIHASSFTEGMLDNTNAQTFFDLFLTDNFKINQNFESVAKLKEALNLSTGNLNNLSIVKPRYNDSGKLIGFTRYDKFSDAALEKAFKDSEAILVPDSVIGSLDRMCKKDARMSSKVYRFINKYLTVPFKFGTLANPGFLAGNIQDAYFKQAVELSKKYGTTLEDELTNVAMSMRHVTVLNNNFSDVFDTYRQWLKDTDINTITRSDKPTDWYTKTFKHSKALAETLTPDQVLDNPELYKAFKEYVNTHLDVKKRKMANLYLFLNSNQTTTMFKNNNRDLEDVASLMTDNEYNIPNNFVERIMYGNPSQKGLNSYGLFLNNPISNKILKSSNNIENWMRSSTIINDLQHQGYTMEDICDILELDKVSEKATRTKFKMSMNEAVATMHAANFDYDNVSEFMNKASFILPFPTFYLKNLAFWADIFTNKPQLIDNVISVHEGLWSGKDTSDEFTAEAKGRGAIPIGQQGNKHLTGIVKQTPYNSMFGAFNAINDFKEDFAYRTNPILRPVARHLQDPEDVRYRPYNTQQYQKNIKKGDPQFSELAYMFHQLNPYERFMNTYLRTPGKVSNNSYQLSDFLPSMFQPDFGKK